MFFLLVLGVLVSGCRTPGSAKPRIPEFSFAQYDVVTGHARDQTVLTGHLLGGAVADLAVVHADADGARRLRIYAFDDDAWAPELEATLGPGVLFVDVANIDGRDRLITYQRGRLSWFDPDSGMERPLVELAANYNSRHDLEGPASRPGGKPPRVDITRDLNRDGLDDVVVPDFDGFWVSIQRSDGSFAEAVKLGPPEPFLDELVGNMDLGNGSSGDARTLRDVGITASTLPLYLNRVHQMDYDQDGRSDLVFWNEDRFEVHLQDEDGLFSPVAETFAPGVPFASEGVYSHAFDFRGQGLFSVLFGFGEKRKRTVLHSLRDLNGDQVADLMTLTLSGRSLPRQRSVYEVHFGTATPDGTEFGREAGTAIHPRGKGGGLQPWGYSSQWLQDFDGDGQVDILFSEVNVGIRGMARALVGNSVPINLELYRIEDGIYPEKPTIRRRIRRFAPFAGLGNVFFPPVLMGDVNGDGRSDLLVGHSPETLHVFLGVPGPDLLERRPLKVAVALPPDERRSWLVDLNQDGKQDLLIHHAPTERAPDVPNRLTTLIAR